MHFRLKYFRAFTLVELLVAVAIVAILISVSGMVYHKVQQAGRKAASASNLRQLSLAALLYANEHQGRFFPYRQRTVEGNTWWFGFESRGSAGSGEGDRELEKEGSPLFPYLREVGGVEICPGFLYDKTIWKPKFEGASYGYGYNIYLGGGWMGSGRKGSLVGMERPSQVALFATCAQVNTFQAPASPDNPLVEEFYAFDDRYKTIHFRFNRTALVSFCDGHIEAVKMEPGTRDERIPEANIGRFSPVGSMKFLR